MAPALTVAQLEQATFHIIHLIRNTRGIENTQLAVIGDLALCKHIPQSDPRRVRSIDLIVSKSSSPGRVKKEIVGHPMSPLIEKAGTVFYRHTSGWEMEVQLIPDWLCPYLPTSARLVRDDTDTLPYISRDDLFVFKVDACSLHDSAAGKSREACDAAALLECASEHFPLKLDDDKMERVEEGLADVVEFSRPECDKSWWQRHLGQLPDKQRSAQEILCELADIASLPTSPTSPASPSNFSSVSRSSSYMSSSSIHSTSSSMSSILALDDKQPEKPTRPRKMSMTGSTPRHKMSHKRHPSTGGAVTKTTLAAAMKRLELERPASPGMGLTNLI
ncbi:hypothetical protein B0J13DRAFT_446762 [Dactylonectria estremocensis]|uniref:Uncharacterized protein n=1 Tax=Dactylonectria estremocensis TaxID=1079267 RepID=A0A9P9EN70_9HYPO|nr:hypothetical protein B0J13DRAFT_446762 [Dactylonectria estremocensis]